MAGAGHCAVGTVAAAGMFSFLFIFDKLIDNCRNDEQENKADYNC